MNRTIGVVTSFHSDAHKEKINAAAEKLGFSVRYFASDAEAEAHVADCEILFSHSSPELLKKAENLKWFCCDFAGVDKYLSDDVYCNSDCILTNSSGAYGTTIAEHLIMVSLMLLRRQLEYGEVIREGDWRVLPGGIRSLRGSRITMLGSGDIGTEFARRAKAFHPAKITGVRRSAKGGDPAFDEIRTIDELNDILPETDLLVMALPSTPATVGILSHERIALLPKGALVINVGRGTAVDQDALIEALNSEAIGGAALDVVVPEPLPADHPLRAAKNILLTPHVAGNLTLGYTCQRNVELFLEDLDNYAAGLPLKRFVDRKKGY